MCDLPTGTVTFLFSDIEGSTRLLHELGAERYAQELAEHRRVLRGAFERYGGVEVDTQGDAFFVAFPTAPGALEAAAYAREALEQRPIRVRIGIHTGTPLLTEEGYVGADVHRAARIAAAGHGGQVLISAASASLLEPSNSLLLDLGEHRLKDLSAPERIYQLGEHEFPPLESLYRTNLPVPATPFVGRERELAEVLTLLSGDDVRLLTLTGPGGTGKTRLGLQAAAEVAERHPDGVFWVPLAPLRDPRLVLASAGQALGASGGLAEHIADKRLLLLLDNFEHLVEAAHDLPQLLASCPNLNLVVTSRELLRVPGEQDYPVPPLDPQDGEQLFMARARAVKPEFEPNNAIAELCARLDNLPLALELAAARVRTLSPAQLLARLSSRLDLLKAGRGVDPRQQTLRATIEWSYELLDEEEQRLFGRLGVFRGGCTLEAGEEVCDADLDTLESLVDKSLVRVRDDERFWMLETIREYATERLGESADTDDLRRRHGEFFIDIASAHQGDHFGPRETEFYAWFDGELDNLRTALAWGIEAKEIDLAARLGASLHLGWYSRGMLAEGRKWLEEVLELGRGEDLVARRRVLVGAAEFAGMLGSHTGTRAYVEESLEIARELGDPLMVSGSLGHLGHLAGFEGDHTRARELYDEALAIEVAAGASDLYRVRTASNLGYALMFEGNRDRARTVLEEALTLARSSGSNINESMVLNNLATVDLGDASYLNAEAHSCDALRRLEGSRDVRLIEESFGLLARAASAMGRDVRAARLTGAADALRAQSPRPTDEIPHEELLDTARAALGRRWNGDYDLGRAMPVDEAVEYALRAVD